VSGVEDVKISVLDPTAIEVGGGIGFCMKRGGVLGFTFALCPDQVSFLFYGVKADVLGNF